MWAGTKKYIANFYRFRYLPTNDTILKVTPNDIDLLFQDKTFEIVVSWKQWELTQTCEISLNTLRFSNILVFKNADYHLAVPADLSSTCMAPAVELLLSELQIVSDADFIFDFLGQMYV